MVFETHSEIGIMKENQDAWAIIEDGENFCMAVSDGHGKYGKQAANTIIKKMQRWAYLKEYDDKKQKFFLKKQINCSSRSVRSFYNSGAALSCFWRIGAKNYVFQIGDSPIYLKIGNSIKYFYGHGVQRRENRKDLDTAIRFGGNLKIFKNNVYLCCDEKQKFCIRVTKCFGSSNFGNIIGRTAKIIEVKGNVDCVLIASNGCDMEEGEFSSLAKHRKGMDAFVASQKRRGIYDNLTMCLAYL